MKNSLNFRLMMKRAPFILIGAGFWILLYMGTYKVLSFVRGIDFFGEILSAKLLSMTFFGLTGFLVLSNVITAISSFYLSRDIPFLLTKPIAAQDIIRLKVARNIPQLLLDGASALSLLYLSPMGSAITQQQDITSQSLFPLSFFSS